MNQIDSATDLTVITPGAATGLYRWIMLGLIVLFVLSVFLADLWPARNVYFLIFHKVDSLLTMELPINAAMRYSAGHTENSCDSLPYVLLLKLIHIFIPGRLQVLRIASVAAALVALVCLYRMSSALFGRVIASIYLFLLVTSPVYLEGMRSFGFIPFTAALVAISTHLLFSTLNRKRTLVRVMLLSGCSFLLLSGYALGRVAIVFPLIIYGISPKRNWRKLIIYTVVLVSLIMVFDLASGDTRFDFKDWYTVGTEWMMNRSNQPLHIRNSHRVLRNTTDLADYFLQRDRTPFMEPTSADDLTQARIFNPVYTPFFLAGLIFCLVKRKQNQVSLLLWAGCFILALLPTTELAMRRFIFALPPIYLLLALGLRRVYQALLHLAGSASRRRILLSVSLVFLCATGGYDLYEYFFRVARPKCDYSSSQLAEVAEYIEQQGREVSSIVIGHSPIFLPLIWGNPHFDPRVVRVETAKKIVYEHQEGITLRGQIDRALYEGTGTLYLYPFFPGAEIEYGPELRNELRQLSEQPPPGVSVSRVPGVEMYGVTVKNSGFHLPASANRAYRYALYKNEQSISVSSEYSWDNSHRQLVDGRPETFWKISPPEIGKPVWVLFDLGREGTRAIRSLSALPRADRPEEFFRESVLLGSKDGRIWENVTPIIQQDAPRSGVWLHWNFDNETEYRFYKLEIYNGYACRDKNFISLAGIQLR